MLKVAPVSKLADAFLEVVAYLLASRASVDHIYCAIYRCLCLVDKVAFGSEFTAMKQAIEIVKALRYKLRMFGIPMDGPANLYCDNEAVFKNVAMPSSVLNKKMHSISYHFCREAVAAGIVRVAKEDTTTNLSDLFTKVLPKARRDELLDKFMY